MRGVGSKVERSIIQAVATLATASAFESERARSREGRLEVTPRTFYTVHLTSERNAVLILTACLQSLTLNSPPAHGSQDRCGLHRDAGACSESAIHSFMRGC